MKSFFSYLGFSILLMGSMIGLLSVRQDLKERADMEFDVVPLIIFDHVYPVLFGMLFALPFFWKRLKESRLKGFVWEEFICIGLPSLFIALSHWLYFTNFPMNPLTKFFALHEMNGSMLFGFIFGFTVIHSIRNKMVA
ncbi:hypothetical protein [Halobacillus karajensis]|uniref:Uncharacterized protein n=1 Tax=Halobacillus karajensis TaxID=195088 RepID=A0A024P786_9BACI|nr:hypothetical protein [Halobacillus karajensis]CDQ17774.1 hypothetical protein BN982_00012 [Halobacillus karajensis]CDQ24182.1 hypothetical protein BN983_02451 [Halobacillus karajensis]CDQ29571.1 hypothetical protein BN981_03954 [Halobacillus karajensis]